jgi:hypothetical protein
VFFIQNVAEHLILLKKNDSDQGEADHRLALSKTAKPKKLLEHIERKLALEARATRDKAASSEN